MMKNKIKCQIITPIKDRSVYDKYIEDTPLPVKIDKNIPIPGQKKPFVWAKLLAEMELGDSILLESKDAYKQIAAIRITGKKKGMEFIQRKQSKGIRLWRTK